VTSLGPPRSPTRDAYAYWERAPSSVVRESVRSETYPPGNRRSSNSLLARTTLFPILHVVEALEVGVLGPEGGVMGEGGRIDDTVSQG